MRTPFKPHEQMSIFERNHGYYYVVYPDGGRSRLMQRDIAQSYAAIFNGTVVRDPDAPPTIGERIKRLFGRK